MMSDELRAAVSENHAVKDAASVVQKARQDLVEACTGTRPIDMRRIGREERSILFAAQEYRSAEHEMNRAVAEAVREMMESS